MLPGSPICIYFFSQGPSSSFVEIDSQSRGVKGGDVLFVRLSWYLSRAYSALLALPYTYV